MANSHHVPDYVASILIVDDERQNRRLLEVMLKPEGYQLFTAATGDEALTIVSKQAPDLILLDIMMPGMDGYEVVAEIKGNLATHNIPIIMITALDDRNAKMRALLAGAEEYLTKPVDRAELCVRVKNLLRLKAYSDYHDKYSHMLEGEVGSRIAELRSERDKARRYLNTAEIILLALDKVGRITLVNRYACSVLGWNEDELLGQDWIEMCIPTRIRDDLKDKFQSLLRDDLHSMENPILTKSGEERLIEWHNTLLRDEAGNVTSIFSSGTDITDRRKLEAQYHQAQKLEAIGLLAAGVAHDFNNILSIIIGQSEMILEKLLPEDPSRHRAEEIRKAGFRASMLTRQLLVFSRKQKTQMWPLDLNHLVKESKKLLERLIAEDISIHFDLHHAALQIKADPSQIEQVIMNLAINARDAMPQGGNLSIATTEFLNSNVNHPLGLPVGNFAQLTVRDSGEGMSNEVAAHVFEPFFTTKKDKGTGLGLATVYGIVKEHKGVIEVQSEPGKGTVFTLYWPIIQAPSREDKRSEMQGKRIVGTETVLLVEDEPVFRSLLSEVMEERGYNILRADNGVAALELAEQIKGPIHLLITDVIMPQMNGAILAERLKIKRPAMKVLFISGYTDDILVKHGRKMEGIPLLMKPFSPSDLGRKVREVLDVS